MILIIEGPDGVGKSTLARLLADTYNLQYHHEGPLPPGVNALDYYGGVLQRARRHRHDTAQGTVLDRLFLGETVYGPLLRKGSRLDPAGVILMQRLVSAAGAMQILCLPPYEVCLRNWQSDRPELISRDSEDVFRASYIGFAEQVAGQYLFDYTRSNLDDLLSRVSMTRTTPRCTLNYIGSPNAQILFVGERGSQKESATVDLPFWGTDNSSQFLNFTLAGLFREADMAFVNAFDQFGGRNILSHRNGHGQPWHHVVALGRAAEKACRRADLKHVMVPHPQYWRRFKFNQLGAYRRLILDATNAHPSPLAC